MTEGASLERSTTVAEEIGAQGRRPELAESPQDRTEARAALLERCNQDAAAVAQKSPGEAEASKQWLVTLARKTAAATTEDGFLGIGDNLAQVVSWYDNEWRYSVRVADLMYYVATRGIWSCTKKPYATSTSPANGCWCESISTCR